MSSFFFTFFVTAMTSKVERKCEHCDTWNIGDHDNCKNCGKPIKPEKIIESRADLREQKEAAKPLDKIDVQLKKLKEHPNLFVRILFKVVYSTWVIFMAIVSAIVYVVALTPG